MAITYPLTPPTDWTHSFVKWGMNNLSGVGVSPFTGQQQIHDWTADFWDIEVSFDPMTREEAAPWIAFMAQLRGSIGTFRYGDILTATAQGSPGGTARVMGANQTGLELITDGWTISTAIFKKGDKIQIDNSLYVITADVSSNGSGVATLDIWPQLRGHGDNTVIVYSNAKGLFRLVQGSEVAEEIGRSGLWNLSFKAVEAI
jgi:hypothetical protein